MVIVLVPPSSPKEREVTVAQLMNGRSVMKSPFIPIFDCRDFMSVLGVTLSRNRAAYTIISLPVVEMDKQSKLIVIEKPKVCTRTISRLKGKPEEDPFCFMSAIRSSLGLPGMNSSMPVRDAGILGLPSISSDSSADAINLLKFHAVIAHELRREFGIPVNEIPIASVRRELGLGSSNGSDAKRKLVECFQLEVSDRDSSSTNNVHQTMAESWGVAHVLQRRQLIKEIRTRFPEAPERVANEVRNRKVFRDRGNAKDEVIHELINSEVDKILLKRLGF